MAFAEIVFNLPASGTYTYEASGCEKGQRVMAEFGSRKLTGYVIGTTENPPEGKFTIKAVSRVIDSAPIFNDELVDLARWVSSMYFCSLGEALAAMLPGGKRESSLPAWVDDEGETYLSREAAPQQRMAIESILGRDEGMSYVYGVTGSGKTEVFLRAAEGTLSEGRGVIYLVPEISLTHQLAEEVGKRFSGRAAILHSGLTPSQKLVEWMRIMRGEASLVIGARSAVFAPVKRLGLLVIDEEHEGSYKSGSTPRYHARQVAMKRALMNRCRLVMGSATPSLEAYHLMGEGRIAKLHLPERLSGGSMPLVEVVDMKRETGAISKRLAEEIRRVKEEGRQTILFLNRRGFSYFFHCRSCGYEMTCKHCSVSLTYHKSRDRMICHYCGYNQKPVDVCPECGSLDVGYSGFGTELIEEEVRRLFPDFTIARVDTDSTQKRDSLKTILADFKERKIDLLLGTQMVAKGLNFPGVRLVGIVCADTALHLPDFRALERTFSLIVQVSGRAGRYLSDGRVIIQTFRPENEAIRRASSGDVDGFFNLELEARKGLGFPPYGRIIRLVFRGRERERVTAKAHEFGRLLAAQRASKTDILGPAECPLSLIAGNYREQLILRTGDFSSCHLAVERVYRSFDKGRNIYIEIDVDPVSIL